MKNTILALFFDKKKKKIKLDQRVLIFFFCLIISLFFWFLAALSKEYSTFLKVPLEYTELPDEYILTEAPVAEIEIQVYGNGFNLFGEQYKLNRNPIQVELGEFLKKKNSLQAISTERFADQIKQQLRNGLELEKIYLDSIRFTTKLQEIKEIPVEAKTNLSFEAGYRQFGEIEINPKTIKVIGPKDLIDQLKTVATKTIELSNLKKTAKGTYQLDIESENELLEFKPNEVEVTIPVEKFTEKVFELPITIVAKKFKKEIRTFPEQVKVIFNVPISRFDELNEVKLKAIVNMDEYDPTKKKLLVEIIGAPEDLELVRIEPDKVEYIILN